MKRKINELLVIGLTATIFFGSFFAGEYLQITRGNKDIWWTPMSMALPLDQSRTEFELFIQKEMLQKHIEKGALLIVGDNGKSVKVKTGDVKVRLNNWHKVKTEKMQYAILTVFFLGASIAVLIIGLIQFVKTKKIDAGSDKTGNLKA